MIHTGYIHDFSPTANPAAAAAVDGGAIAAFGEALAGTGKPLVVASGLPAAEPGRRRQRKTDAAPENPHYPRVSERAALALAGRGVRVSVVRLPPSVHGEGDYAFVPSLIAIARDKGLSAYVGDGANVWPAVHRLDAARLFRLALEQAPAGTLLNGVGDEGVPFREIAEVIGRHLNVPVKSITAEEARDALRRIRAVRAVRRARRPVRGPRSGSAGGRPSPGSSRISTRGTTTPFGIT